MYMLVLRDRSYFRNSLACLHLALSNGRALVHIFDTSVFLRTILTVIPTLFLKELRLVQFFVTLSYTFVLSLSMDLEPLCLAALWEFFLIFS